jgi:hypothetical protein
VRGRPVGETGLSLRLGASALQREGKKVRSLYVVGSVPGTEHPVLGPGVLLEAASVPPRSPLADPALQAAP